MPTALNVDTFRAPSDGSCGEHAFGVTCGEHAFGVTCGEHAFGVTCGEHASGRLYDARAPAVTRRSRRAADRDLPRGRGRGRRQPIALASSSAERPSAMVAARAS